MSERKVGVYAEAALTESKRGDAALNGITIGTAIGLAIAISPQNPELANTIMTIGVIVTLMRFGGDIENLKIRRLIERGQ